jgi:dihydrofolate reductase
MDPSASTAPALPYGTYPNGMKIKIIVACTHTGGIGYKGKRPFFAKADMDNFARVTKEVSDSEKINGCLMGLETWGDIPVKFRPFKGRRSYVLSTRGEAIREECGIPKDVKIFTSTDEALEAIGQELDIESIWICGGVRVYNDVLHDMLASEIWLTLVNIPLKCDKFIDPSFLMANYRSMYLKTMAYGPLLDGQTGIAKPENTEFSIGHYVKRLE